MKKPSRREENRLIPVQIMSSKDKDVGEGRAVSQELVLEEVANKQTMVDQVGGQLSTWQKQLANPEPRPSRVLQ